MAAPEWLLRLIVRPPAWLRAGLRLLATVWVLGLAVRISQQGGVSLATQRRMLTIAATVVAVMAAVLAFANLLRLPYRYDVYGGFLVGYTTVLAAQQAPWDRWLPTWSPRERVMGGWLLVGTWAMFVGRLQVRGAGYIPEGSRFAVFGLAVAVVVYDAVVEHRARAATSPETDHVRER